MRFFYSQIERSTLRNWILFTLSLTAFAFSSCTDECETTRTYVLFEPVYKTTDEIRSAVSLLPPQIMKSSGKIYLKGHLLFINEPNNGIHIIDNSDQRNPQNIGFINIPGNFDLAAKGNYLYADSYIDLLVFDISDINNIQLVKRLENVFPLNWGYFAGSPMFW